MKKLTMTLLVPLLMLIGCKGPVGPAGEDAPNYPIHKKFLVSFLETFNYRNQYYIFIDFDSDYRIGSSQNIDSYDLRFEFNKSNISQVVLTHGISDVLYKENSVSNLTEAAKLPSQEIENANIENNSIFFLRNELSRYAKFKIEELYFDSFYIGSTHYYAAEFTVEYYYYKDEIPDFSLHKTCDFFETIQDTLFDED